MGQLHPLPKTTTHEETPPLQVTEASVSSIEPVCGLCGKRLGGRALRYQLVPPQAAHQPITVCHTCRKAALGEGYRPAI